MRRHTLANAVLGNTATVTGQSLVLYSRLHLIDHDRRHLRAVLAMIITNGIILHTTTAVVGIGSNVDMSVAPIFFEPYSIVERVQVTVFFVQEVTISGLYIWATAKFFHDSALHAASTRAKLLWHLIAVNVLVIFINITILGLEFADLYKLQASYQAMAYSIKLKIEFNILNRLVNVTRERAARSSDNWDSALTPSSNPSATANTTSTTAAAGGGAEDRRWSLVKWNSLTTAACFPCGRRASKADEEEEGSRDSRALRTAEVSAASRDEEPPASIEMEERLRTAGVRESVNDTSGPGTETDNKTT